MCTYHRQNDANNNPRATVADVYDVIVADLTKAIELLDGYSRTDKTQIDQHVAYGLRARAYLAMGEYAKAAEDADKAMQGYTPASIADVSVPAFDNINESNWIWGFGMTNAMVMVMAVRVMLTHLLGLVHSLVMVMLLQQEMCLASMSCFTTRFHLPTFVRDGG